MTTELVALASERIAVSNELGLSGRLVGSDYTLPPGTPIEAWLMDGVVLQEMEKRIGFWVGDWLRAGEQRYGERQYTQALQATGYAYQTLKNARRVASRFPADTRVHEGLAFAHYDAVAGLPQPDAVELLEEAVAVKLSSKDLRERARFRQSQIAEATRSALPVPRMQTDGIDLWVGDALDLTLDDGVVDLIVTSPPYALEKAYDGAGDIKPLSWFDCIQAACTEAFRVAKPGARFALNVPIDTTLGGNRPTHAQAVSAAMMAGWSYRSTIIWIDDHLGKSTARGSYDQERMSGTAAAPSIIAPAETIILLSKGRWWRQEPPDRPSDIRKEDWLDWTNGNWFLGGETNGWEDHPAPFPEEIPRRLINLLSFPGDLVLDPFVGSGTTAVAAVKAGRRCVGVDLSQAYINSARRRLASVIAAHPGLARPA